MKEGVIVLRRIIAAVCLLLLLTGCAPDDNAIDRAMALRSKILSSAVEFETQITADFGKQIYTFTVQCTCDKQGNLKFTVKSPETIAGISGTMASSGGALTFDGQALSFPLLADGQVTPVSAPWVLMRTLRSGYLTSCAADGETLRISIDDSYENDALHLEVWLDENDFPRQAEVYWQGRRVLSMNVTNFRFV